ncbi:MAG: O-antigen ligase family protein [Alphaproteobacteria bacterium]|nr:O-antigen ligase family protein [Alphaproteobacteria bacterium]
MKTAVLGASYAMALLLLLRKAGVASFLFGKILPLFILAAYAALTCVWSEAPDVVLFRVAHILGLGFVAISTGLWIRGRTWSFFPILLMLMFGMECLSLYYVYFVPTSGLVSPELGHKISRWTGVTQHPNFLGAVCVVSFWSALSCLSQKTKLATRFVAWASVPLSLILLQGSGSRTSMATVFVLAAAAFLMRGTKPFGISMFSKKLSFLLLLTLVVLSLSFAAAPNLVKSIFLPEARIGAEDGLSGRPAIWARGCEALVKNPFGWSFDDLTTYWTYTSFTERYLHFHNGFLDIAVKGGVVAELLLLTLLYLMFRCALRLRVYEPVFAKCFLSFLLCNLIYNITESGFDRETLLWPVLIVVWCCSESLLLVRRGVFKPVLCSGQKEVL